MSIIIKIISTFFIVVLFVNSTSASTTNDFNEWYGVLSSDEGGLGWSMWGSTPYDYSLNLLRKLLRPSKP